MIKLYSLFQTAVSSRISQWNLWKQEALREHTPPPIFIFKGIFIYIHLIFFHIFNMLSDVCSKDLSKCRLVLFTRGWKQHFNRHRSPGQSDANTTKHRPCLVEVIKSSAAGQRYRWWSEHELLCAQIWPYRKLISAASQWITGHPLSSSWLSS